MRRENWIKWDLDSRTGFKMASFFAKHGSNGYGFFVVLIELLYRAKDYKIEYKLIQTNTNYFKISAEDTKVYIDSLIELGLFSTDENKEFVWSDRVLEEVGQRDNHAAEVSESRRNAVKKRWAKIEDTKEYKPIQTDTNDTRGDKIRSVKNRSDLNKTNVLVFPEWIDSNLELRNSLLEWIAQRQQRKKPVSQLALNKNLKKFDGQPQRLLAALEHTIANDYQGIYEPSTNGTSKLNNADKTLTAAQNIINRMGEYGA